MNNYEDSSIKLETRAILFLKNKILFFINSNLGWRDFFSRKLIDKNIINKIEPHLKVYKAYNSVLKGEMNIYSSQKFETDNLKKFAKNITLFTECIRKLINTGSIDIDKRIAGNLPDSQIFTNLPAHTPSLRLSINALKQYNNLMNMGMNGNLCKSYIASLCADSICNGQYRDIKIGELTSHEIVKIVAESYGMLPNSFNYSFDYSA